MKLLLGIYVYDRQPIHKLCFCPGRIRTLIAMVTYIFHILMMGKVGNDFFCFNGYVYRIIFNIILNKIDRYYLFRLS